MDYPNLNQENVQTYYPLGSKTLFMFILRRSGFLFFFLIVMLIGLFFLPNVPADYSNLAANVMLLYVALLLVSLLVVILIGWLEYFRYGIVISEKNLIIRKGFIATEEIGIPFRRIRDLKIKRSLIDQLFGVSDIVVILSDFEERGNSPEESIIFLPALAKKTAASIQAAILKKSQVEQIDVLSGHENILERQNDDASQLIKK